MTYNRWHQLHRRLRLWNPCPNARTQPRLSLFQRVDDWSQFIQQASRRLWQAGTTLAVDECMVGFTGRAREKVTIPRKPTPTGFKVWAVAQAGYFLGWLWHDPFEPLGPAAKRPRKRPRTEEGTIYLNPTQSVVIALIKQLPEQTYHVFMDNLFSSPALFLALRKLGIGATGTARINSGLYAPFVNQIAWKDNALVLFYTTIYTGHEFCQRVRRRPTTTHARARPIQQEFGAEPVKTQTLPSISIDYNDKMGAVDIGDQLRASEGIEHRVRKGSWRALAWTFLLEVALTNSYLLQLHGQVGPGWKAQKTQRGWRQLL
ncbi:Uncharacterized protein TPAR_08914, partial [Tolypocladium paradoxum]